MSDNSDTTADLIVKPNGKIGRTPGELSPGRVKNAVYTDQLRERYHDPAITVLRMTLPDEHDDKLPFDKEKAEVLVKLCKYFHHPRTPIKTDGNDAEKKSITFNVTLPDKKGLPIIEAHAEEVEDGK